MPAPDCALAIFHDLAGLTVFGVDTFLSLTWFATGAFFLSLCRPSLILWEKTKGFRVEFFDGLNNVITWTAGCGTL